MEGRRLLMGKNGAKDSVIELCGRGFRRVKDGLDEAQVLSFVNELISQRDILAKREEHLSSLTKLAEKTVAEADKLASGIKTEAMEQAKAEAAAITARAEEQAQQMIEEKRAEIVTIASKEAATIKSEAEREAGLLLEKQRKMIQPELSNFAHRLYSQLLSELESLKQQIAALEGEFEHKLSQSVEEASTVTAEDNGRHDEFLELIQIGDQTKDQTDAREPEWELEILPPIDIMKIMGIVTYLDSLPEVEKTDMIPENDKPSIVVFLREPVHLIDMLRALPEVAQVKEDTTDTAGTEGKAKKVQLVLSVEAMPEEGKERVSGVANILSSAPHFTSF